MNLIENIVPTVMSLKHIVSSHCHFTHLCNHWTNKLLLNNSFNDVCYVWNGLTLDCIVVKCVHHLLLFLE